MKKVWGLVVGMLVIAGGSSARGSQTITATFENFTEGQSFTPSFTDPLTGIGFRNPTTQNKYFTIEFSSFEFGGGNYLTANAYNPGPQPGWAFNFGLTADLPAPANRVSVDVTYARGSGNTSSLILQGFNAADNLVIQQTAPANAGDTFTLQIASAQFDITHIKIISAANVATGYDNFSFTVIPEPTGLGLSVIITMSALMPRRRFI